MARREDKELADLMERFVCVRVVQAAGMDLTLFQFDPDLTWAVFLMNADKTLYGRYGTRGERDASANVSLEGFKKAVQGAWELHQAYPANKTALAGKTGPAPAWRTPEAIPTLSGRFKSGDLSPRGCMHCHYIKSGEVQSLWKSRRPVPDRALWSYAMPNLLGLVMTATERATVKSVTAGSAAQKAGFAPGDRIVSMQGQPLLSTADLQWVLQQATEPGELKAQVERAGKTVTLALPLASGWRRGATWAWPNSAGDILAWELGLRRGDTVVELDGRKGPMSWEELIATVFQKKSPGDKIPATVTSEGGKTRTFDLTLP